MNSRGIRIPILSTGTINVVDGRLSRTGVMQDIAYVVLGRDVTVPAGQGYILTEPVSWSATTLTTDADDQYICVATDGTVSLSTTPTGLTLFRAIVDSLGELFITREYAIVDTSAQTDPAYTATGANIADAGARQINCGAITYHSNTRGARTMAAQTPVTTYYNAYGDVSLQRTSAVNSLYVSGGVPTNAGASKYVRVDVLVAEAGEICLALPTAQYDGAQEAEISSCPDFGDALHVARIGYVVMLADGAGGGTFAVLRATETAHETLTGLNAGTDGGHAFLRGCVTSTLDPAVTDDAYRVGTKWVNTTTGQIFVVVDTTAGAAEWVQLTSPIMTVDSLAHYADKLTGFESRTPYADMSFDESTLTFTIDNIGVMYSDSKKYDYTGETRTIVLPGTAGLYCIYFDANGAIQYVLNDEEQVDFILVNYCIATLLYYNPLATLGSRTIYFADERHNIHFHSTLHSYLHHTLGTLYVDGLALTNFNTTDPVSSNTRAQFGVADGKIYDEDLIHDLTSTVEETLTTPATIPVLHRLGATGVWYRDSLANFGVLASGGKIQWNEFTGATWQLTQVPNLDFVNYHYFATNDMRYPIIAFAPQQVHLSRNDAQANAGTEITTLLTTGIPLTEFRPIATVIYGTRANYTNAIGAIIVETEEGDNYVDFRASNFSAAQATSNDHSSLSNLNADDHPQYCYCGSDQIEFAGVVGDTVAVTGTNTLCTFALRTVSGGEGFTVSLPAIADLMRPIGQKILVMDTGGQADAVNNTITVSSSATITGATTITSAYGVLQYVSAVDRYIAV